MKFIKTFLQLKESLDSDFEKATKKLVGEYEGTYQELTYKFKDALTDKGQKGEFMYRLSDGEDFIKLVKEFLDKKYQFSGTYEDFFRGMVADNLVAQVVDEFNAKVIELGVNVVKNTMIVGLEASIKDLQTTIEAEKDFDLDNCKEVIKDTMNYYKKLQQISDWKEGKEKNKYSKEIKTCEQLLDALEDFYDPLEN